MPDEMPLVEMVRSSILLYEVGLASIDEVVSNAHRAREALGLPRLSDDRVQQFTERLKYFRPH